MADVLDVAKYILEKNGAMSTWKLQKLCYYAQAWALAWTEKPLFAEDFEAWSNGPVCPKLFHAHRGKFIVDSDDIHGDSTVLTDEERDTINRVLEHYGTWEPYELREQTHGEAPWKDARGDIPESLASRAVISKSSMGEYYGAL